MLVNDVSIVVVTWNSARHIAGLGRSLREGLVGVDRWELVVADNSSSDDTSNQVAHHLPGATTVQLGRNAGFAAGVNAGVTAAAPAAAVLVLNADVRLGPGCVATLLSALDLPRTGIAVPRLLCADGTLATSLRREPTVLRALGEAVLGGRRAGHVAALGELVVDHRVYERAAVMDWATGAAMLISRACLHAVGNFDESFFLYSEETDFALRARDAGFVLRYAPDAVAVHEGGASGTSPPLYALMTLNRVRLFARRHGRAPAAAFWAALSLGEGLRALSGRTTNRAAIRVLTVPSARADLLPFA